MYDELYEAWRREIENVLLCKLPDNFYPRVAEYVKKLQEDHRMIDRRTMKASLLRKQTVNVKLMLRELMEIRYAKLSEMSRKSEPNSEVQVVEEEKLYSQLSSCAERYNVFVGHILRGYQSEPKDKTERKTVVLRFQKDVPAIIGVDMKAYGPFRVEDVASLPTENGRVLAQKEFAVQIEIE
jgi:DNA replication factor GINS